MALILKDRIRETTSISGTATYELDGATTGFEGFSEIGTGIQPIIVALMAQVLN